MTQQMKVLANSVSWSLEPTWHKKKTSVYNLTFDLHKPTVGLWGGPLSPHKISGERERVRKHFEGVGGIVNRETEGQEERWGLGVALGWDGS